MMYRCFWCSWFRLALHARAIFGGVVCVYRGAALVFSAVFFERIIYSVMFVRGLCCRCSLKRGNTGGFALQTPFRRGVGARENEGRARLLVFVGGFLSCVSTLRLVCAGGSSSPGRISLFSFCERCSAFVGRLGPLTTTGGFLATF